MPLIALTAYFTLITNLFDDTTFICGYKYRIINKTASGQLYTKGGHSVGLDKKTVHFCGKYHKLD